MRLEGRFLISAEVMYFDFALSLVLIDVFLSAQKVQRSIRAHELVL